MADVTNTYYAGEAFIGYGAQLLVGQGDDPETFVAVADVTEITPGDMTSAVIDKTHLRSPEAHREKLVGLRDSGPFALSGNWRPTHGSQSNAGGDGFTTGLMGIWRTRQEANFKIVVVVQPNVSGTAISLSGVTRTGTTATATSGAAHGLTTGDLVLIAGATPTGYNGIKSITVASATTFTYTVDDTLTTPATGTIPATQTGALEWPFRGAVSKFQPGAIGVDDKTGFTAEITPLSDFSADLP